MSFNVTLSIPAIGCSRCVMNIKRKTQDLPGVLSVDADEIGKTATYVLESETVLVKVKEVLAEIGFPAAV
jgi:copper chaperone CopZ